ncbi:hypothetical protein B0T20DRAFT_461282 [Sordaria brevicollis]|uniref:Uncharacterized protein n=1 Tax=Sordaria brevicollis TaxID=83679 RepID=A0AAE0PEU6_SORBR|nr:hypothetical protein B0T20DRAFT_461282 [Sordaria brevicollis]
MSIYSQYREHPPALDDRPKPDPIVNHGHQDLVQAVAFNSYGDRCATGSVDGKIRVFNRHKDGKWRVCDSWSAHGGEILELQWLPPTIYPNLLASLGIEGRFKLWAENPSAAPGRRFGVTATHGHAGPGANTLSRRVDGPGGVGLSSLSSGDSKPTPAFDYRNPKSPIRSFSLKHNDDTRHTYLALLSVDGTLEVLENETPENIIEFSRIDQFTVCPKPSRGEETSFRVRFDPNPEVCYTALRAGVPTDALGLVVAAMDSVKVYRTRDTVSASLGVATAAREFYLAAEIPGKDPNVGHRGLVRDVAWAPGNIRGYDILATACQDGYVRVFGLSTPAPQGSTGSSSGGGWGVGEMRRHQEARREEGGAAARALASQHGQAQEAHLKSGIRAGLADQSRMGGGSAGGTAGDRMRLGGQLQPGQVRHVVTEVARLDSHRTPVWRVGFDDDGQILGSFENIPLTDTPNTPAKPGKGGQSPAHTENIQRRPTPARLIIGGDGLVPSHDFKQTSEESKTSSFRLRMFSFESPPESPEVTVMPNLGGAEIRSTSLDAESIFNQFFPVRSTSSSYPSEGIKSPELTVSPPVTFGRRILSSLEAYGFSNSSFLRSSEESAASNQQRGRLSPAAVEGALRELYKEQEAARKNEVIECGSQTSVTDDDRSVKITERELTKPEIEHIENAELAKTPTARGSDDEVILADISAVNTESIISLAIAALHRGKSNSSTLSRPLPRQRPRSSGPSGTGVTPFPSLDKAPPIPDRSPSRPALLSEGAPDNLSTQCLPRVSTNPPRLSTESPTTLEKRYLKPKSRAALPFHFGSPTKKKSIEVVPTVTPAIATSEVTLLDSGKAVSVRKPSGPYRGHQSQKKRSTILRLLRYIFRRPAKAKKWVVRKFRAKRKGVSKRCRKTAKRLRAKAKARRERNRTLFEALKTEGVATAPVPGQEIKSGIVPVTVLEEESAMTPTVAALEIDAVKAEIGAVGNIANNEDIAAAERKQWMSAVVEKQFGLEAEEPAMAPTNGPEVNAVKAELGAVEQIASDEHVAVSEKELTIRAVVEKVDKKHGSDVGSVEEVEDVTVEIHVVDASTCVA